jgi:methylated-DNA-[protein]-cysteine S-methyltransferase
MQRQYFCGTICFENSKKICKISAVLTQDGLFERVFLNLLSQKAPFQDESKPLRESLAAKLIENRFCATNEKVPPHLPFIKTYFYGVVFENLLKVSYGRTITYNELAALCKNPKAARAVGNAMRNNPLPLIYPCHRVVGKNGMGGGFCGSSKEFLQIKEKLLWIEKQNERIVIL